MRAHRRLVELGRVAARALGQLASGAPVLFVRRGGQTAQRQKLVELAQGRIFGNRRLLGIMHRLRSLASNSARLQTLHRSHSPHARYPLRRDSGFVQQSAGANEHRCHASCWRRRSRQRRSWLVSGVSPRNVLDGVREVDTM